MFDLYLLALLNSRVLWWYLYRIWPHKKDEALSVQKPALLSLPIPEAHERLRTDIETLAQQAYAVSGDAAKKSDLLQIELQINDYVIEAYRLSGEEIEVMKRTLPPRDPLVVLERRLSHG